ncbi:GNAT family N-acetyltransferase [Flindersiella endophytica]
MELHVVPYDHPDAVRLIAEVQQEYVIRYGGVDRTPTDPAEFAPPEGRFVVGYLDGTPVACGGWRVSGSGIAEVKRMYVTPAARGRGYARVLLAELERTIADAGLRRVILETGLAQPEAIGLYTSAGYTPIESFGIHRDSPNSRCFAKAVGSSLASG